MLNSKLIGTLSVGFVSSFLFIGLASAAQEGLHYRCDFHAPAETDSKGYIRCSAEGYTCKDEKYSDCENKDKHLKVSCSNGFSVNSRNAAIELEDHNLWVNAVDEIDEKVVTVRIKDFHPTEIGLQSEHSKDATLLLGAQEVWKARYLSGACKIKHEK